MFEGDVDGGSDLRQLERRIFSDRLAFEERLRAHASRPVFDSYAAFEPFNEAGRVMPALSGLLAEHLQPGDVVLDIGCRTGFSSDVLAALFPEQLVLSTWYGDFGALGLAGFDYWLAGSRENLLRVLSPLAAPLPFADGTIAAVHGHDVLHHVALREFLAEVLRVTRPRAPLLFPHVHLANGEPEPYFSRGGTLRHGREISNALHDALAGDSRRAFVMSEARLFAEARAGEVVLCDEPDTPHYNGVVLCAEPTSSRRLRRERGCDAPLRMALNPLVAIDPATGHVAPDPELLGGGSGKMLARHPIYAEVLQKCTLTRLEQTFLFWAERFESVAEIAPRVGLTAQSAMDLARNLEERELVYVEALSRPMLRLVEHFRTRRPALRPGRETLPELWRLASANFPASPWLVDPSDGGLFSYADADAVMALAGAFLRERAVGPGDRVGVQVSLDAISALLLWAVIRLGGVVVPVSPTLGPERLAEVSRVCGLALLVTDRPGRLPQLACPVLRLGSGEVVEGISSMEPLDAWPEVSEDDDVAVLLTSGSTGPPKGVPLSHGALFRSSRSICVTYGWRPEDRALVMGEPHVMSGLRNALVAPLHVGAATVLPTSSAREHPLAALDLVRSEGVTLLNVSPAFLSVVLRGGERAMRFLSASPLRSVLCTGSPLSAALRERFEAASGLPVYDYYGLTETCGLCLAHPTGAPPDRVGVGRPVDSLAAVVDPEGRRLPPGAVGDLRVLSANLARGYLDGRTIDRDELGWLRTGDKARLTPNGVVVLHGRGDRLILHRTGENLQPEEIEAVIAGLAGIEGAYVGQTVDARGRSILCALIGGARGPDETPRSAVEAAIRSKLSAEHVPDRMVWVEALPLGPSGKTDALAAMELLRRHLEEEEG